MVAPRHRRSREPATDAASGENAASTRHWLEAPAGSLASLGIIWYAVAIGLGTQWAVLARGAGYCGTPEASHFLLCLLWLAVSVVLSLICLAVGWRRPVVRDAALRFLATGHIPVAVPLTARGLLWVSG
jgi:hypothetical protein